MNKPLSKVFYSTTVCSITVVSVFVTLLVGILVYTGYTGLVQLQLGADKKIIIAGEKALPYLKDIK